VVSRSRQVVSRSRQVVSRSPPPRRQPCHRPWNRPAGIRPPSIRRTRPRRRTRRRPAAPGRSSGRSIPRRRRSEGAHHADRRHADRRSEHARM